MKKIITTILLITMALALFAGCSNSAENSTDEVVIAIRADITSLDQNTSLSTIDEQILFNVSDGLVAINENNEIVPMLAERWDISSDNLEYTFYLNKGVMFHNGEELKASDVVFTLERLKESAYRGGELSFIEAVEAVDDYTVKITLTAPYSPCLTILAQSALILNEKAVTEAGDDYPDHPVGTGAYEFVEYATGQHVKLEANEKYFKGAPEIKNVTYKVLTDANSALIALETGDVHILNYMPTVSINDVMDNEEFKVYTMDSDLTEYLTFNQEVEPFDDIRVRQAISYAIDKQAIIDIAADGHASAAKSIITSLCFGYSDDVISYDRDVDKALELLSEAGYENGLDIGTLKTTKSRQKIAEIVQENLREVNVACVIEMLESSTFFDDVMKGNYGIAAMAIAYTGDAAKAEQCYTSMNINALNTARYASAELDNMFKNAVEEPDRENRAIMYEEIFNEVAQEAIYAPLYSSYNTVATPANLVINNLNPYGYIKAIDLSWLE